jgi:hypothetical protein
MGWAETMAFWDSVDAGSVAGMKAAVLSGASVDHYNAGLATALHKAAERGDCTMVSSLLDSGASVNLKTRIGNDTALLLAAAHGRLDVVKALLGGGADMSIKNAKGQTAFSVATERRHAEVVEVLAHGTAPQMLAHQRIADRIQSTSSAASSPGMRSAYGSPSAAARTGSRSALATVSAAPETAATGATAVRMVAYVVDPKDRRQVRKRTIYVFCVIFIPKMPSFYQDRLGTNIGKALKKER